MLTGSLGVAAVRIALAILLDAAALIVWDVGTRSPLRLIGDITGALRNWPAVGRGLVRFLTGIIAVLAAVAVSAPVANRAADFTIIECWALVIALIAEGLVGPDLRAPRR